MATARLSGRNEHAFRLVNQAGETVCGRYHWIPLAGAASQSLDELHRRSPTHLFEELEERLGQAPVQFNLEFQVAEEGDPTNDPSAPWPGARDSFRLGTLDIHRPTSVEEIGDLVMLHDPTRATDGVELTDDPVFAARSGIYEVSVAHRTGGWKGRHAAVERAGWPFMCIAKPAPGR